MTKTDEFIELIKQIDPQLTVNKYHNLYDHDHNKVNIIVWYAKDNDTLMPFAIFTNNHDKPVFEIDHNFLVEDDLVVYSKVINLCAEYFPFLTKENK